MKTCIKCELELPDCEFRIRSSGKLESFCKKCTSAYMRAYVESNKTSEGRAAFLAGVSVRKNQRLVATIARRKVDRARKEKNPNVIAYRKRYKSRPERLARERSLRQRPEKKERRAAYVRMRRATDPKFLVHGRMSCMINAKVRRGSKGGKSWRDLVEYTVEQLRAHIERQFLPGMGWHNAKEWHIDHILPVASFDYTSTDDPEFKRCWGLPNLRPLWRLDNIRKHAKIESLL